jgi:hypothetical protein
MAERIRQLPREVVAAFQVTDASQRVQKLRQVGTEVSVGMLPVIGWLERRRPADTAELVKRRMSIVLHEAVQCAGMDIPQYAGGVSARVEGEAAPGALRNAALTAATIVFGASLMDWANDIEAEDGPGTPLLPLTPKEQVVLDIIRERPAGQGIIGKKIIKEAKERGVTISSENTLTSHIIPNLKPYGVTNGGGGRGYYVPPQ